MFLILSFLSNCVPLQRQGDNNNTISNIGQECNDCNSLNIKRLYRDNDEEYISPSLLGVFEPYRYEPLGEKYRYEPLQENKEANAPNDIDNDYDVDNQQGVSKYKKRQFKKPLYSQ